VRAGRQADNRPDVVVMPSQVMQNLSHCPQHFERVPLLGRPKAQGFWVLR
jgi:hypothetical protein